MHDNKKNSGVQMLRAVLFIGIVAFHCDITYSQIFWGGVETFFLISSFFLSRRLIKKDSSELNIFSTAKHRFSRLVSQYYLLLIGAFGLTIIIYKKIPILDFILHILFSQNIYWMITGYKSDMVFVTGHTWTLSVEAYLFLVWLIAFKYIKTYKGRITFNIVMIVVAIAYRTVLTVTIGDAMITSLSPIAHADAFSIGSVMALVDTKDLHSKDKTRKLRFTLLMVIGLGLIFASIWVTASSNSVSLIEGYKLYRLSHNYLNNAFTCNIYLYITMLSAGLLYFSLHIKFSINVLVKLGNLSFTGYLIHNPIKGILNDFILDKWILLVVVLSITIIASMIIDGLISHLRRKKFI